jgi:hypothetical protein
MFEEKNWGRDKVGIEEEIVSSPAVSHFPEYLDYEDSITDSPAFENPNGNTLFNEVEEIIDEDPKPHGF